MRQRLQAARASSASQHMTLRLAYRTTKLAYNLLTDLELRGLIFTASSEDHSIGSVHYDRDASYLHECCAPKVATEMTKQLMKFGEYVASHAVYTPLLMATKQCNA